jgi:hypothetical protein
VADFGNTETMLAGLDKPIQRVLKKVFEYILKDMRFGRAEDGDASKNFGGGFFQSETPSVADTEFSIAHTLGRKPYLVIPVLPLDAVGARIIRLRVTKPADASRIYLSSPDTTAPFFVYVEG